MDIAFVGALTGIGGIQRVVAVVASELSLAHNIHYIDYRGGGDFCYPLPGINDVYDISSSQNRGRQMSLGDDISKMYAHELEQLSDIINRCAIDLVILSGSFCTALIPGLKTRVKNARIIAWQHGNYDIYTGEYSVKYREEYLLGAQMADTVVVLTKQDAQSFKALNRNIVRIPNPLPIEHMERCDINSKRIVFVGRIDVRQKGLDTLIDATDMLDMKGYSLHIVGSGKDTQALIQKVSEAKNKASIFFKGEKLNDELIDEYKSASIFVLPSFWEGFSLSLLEAMSFGLPVISTPNLGASEVLNQGEYGIMASSFSAENLAQAIQPLIDDEELRRHYMQQSLKRIQQFKLPDIMPLWHALINGGSLDKPTVDRIFLVTTLRCNINCRLCQFMSPYFKEPWHPTLDYLKRSIDRIFEIADINRFELVGGEIFIRKDLPELLDYLYERIHLTAGHIGLVTNCAVPMSDKLFSAIARFGDKLLIKLDNYGELSPYFDDILERLTRTRITVETHEYSGDRENWYFGGWIDRDISPEPKYTIEEVKARPAPCDNANESRCLIVARGRVCACLTPVLLKELYGIEYIEDMPLDLFDEKLSLDEARNMIIKLKSTRYTCSCRHHDPISHRITKRYKAAEQLSASEINALRHGHLSAREFHELYRKGVLNCAFYDK